MKKLHLTLIIILIFSIKAKLYSQDEVPYKNSVKINPIGLTYSFIKEDFWALYPSYERKLSDKLAFTTDVIFLNSNDESDYGKILYNNLSCSFSIRKYPFLQKQNWLNGIYFSGAVYIQKTDRKTVTYEHNYFGDRIYSIFDLRNTYAIGPGVIAGYEKEIGKRLSLEFMIEYYGTYKKRFRNYYYDIDMIEHKNEESSFMHVPFFRLLFGYKF